MFVQIREQKTKDPHKDMVIEPFIELPLQVLKIRRNLLLCCILCIGIFFGGRITSMPTAMGITISGLPLRYFPHTMLIITSYFWIYFSWMGWQTYNKWKLRLTGLTPKEHSESEPSNDFTIETDITLNQDTIMKRIEKITTQLNKRENEKEADQNIQSVANSLKKLPLFSQRFWDYQKTTRYSFCLEYWLPVAFGCVSIIMVSIAIITPVDWEWYNANQKTQELSGFCR